MNLTAEQEREIHKGHVVEVTVSGTPCVVLRKDVYEHGEEVDYSPWTAQEIDLLAAEAAALVAGDGLDESDDS